MLTKEQIMERLNYATATADTTRGSVFSADVPSDKIRYIVAIFLIGDRTTSNAVTIEKLKSGHATPPVSDNYETIFNSVPIAPTDVRPIPPTFDIENPIIVLEGGSNLSVVATSKGPNVTVIYWDNEI
jgi:hypothetical protein